MKRLVVDANVAFNVGSFEGTLRSSGSVLDVYFASLSDLQGVRRSAGVFNEVVLALLKWCEANRLSLRIWVKDRVIAESGQRMDGGNGLRIPWGGIWRIRPFELLNVFFKR